MRVFKNSWEWGEYIYEGQLAWDMALVRAASTTSKEGREPACIEVRMCNASAQGHTLVHAYWSMQAWSVCVAHALSAVAMRLVLAQVSGEHCATPNTAVTPWEHGQACGKHHQDVFEKLFALRSALLSP